MQAFANLLAWASKNNTRITLKFIPDQSPSVFVIDAQVPRPSAGKNFYEYVRRRGKTVEDVCLRFMEALNE